MAVGRALGLTGGTGGVNHIDQVLAVHGKPRIVPGLSAEIERVQLQHLQWVRKRQRTLKPALGQQ